MRTPLRLLAASVWVLVACNHYVEFAPSPVPVTEPLFQELGPQIDPVTDTLQTEAEVTDTLTTPAGVELILPGNCLEKCSGSGPCVPCRGPVNVVMRVLFEKRDILLFGKPTASGRNLLETGGQVYLRITQNGEPLRFRAGTYFTLKIPVQRTRADAAKMGAYADTTLAISAGQWQYRGSLADRNAAYYTIQSDQAIGWLSPAYVYASGSATPISLQAQGEATNLDSTQVFVVFKNVHAVVPAVRVAGQFVPTCTLPTGQSVTLVALKRRNHEWLLGKQEAISAPSLSTAIPFQTVTPEQAYEALEVLNR